MTLSRRFVIASVALAPALSRPALAANSKPAAPPPALAAAGALFPLTGAQALAGDECLRGVQLAVDELNNAGGITGQMVSLAIADAPSQDQTEQAVKALASTKNTGFLLGTGSSALSYAGSAAAELAQIPYIELNAPADGITGRGFKFLLRTALTTAMIANTAVSAMAARYAGRKIGLLFNMGATGGAIAAAAMAQWGTAKVTPLLVIGYPEDAANLHEQINRLRRAGVEVLLHAAGLDDALAAFQAMQDSGWKPQALIGCGNGYEFRETAFALGPAFDGTLVAAAPFYPPPAKNVAEAYEARFGMKPRAADSLTAYAGARLVLEVFKNVNGDTTKLLDALRAANLPAGALANGWGAAFDKTGQNTKAFASLQQWWSQGLVPII